MSSFPFLHFCCRRWLFHLPRMWPCLRFARSIYGLQTVPLSDAVDTMNRLRHKREILHVLVKRMPIYLVPDRNSLELIMLRMITRWRSAPNLRKRLHTTHPKWFGWINLVTITPPLTLNSCMSDNELQTNKQTNKQTNTTPYFDVSQWFDPNLAASYSLTSITSAPPQDLVSSESERLSEIDSWYFHVLRSFWFTISVFIIKIKLSC